MRRFKSWRSVAMVPLLLFGLFFLSAASCDKQMGIVDPTKDSTGKITAPATVDPTGGPVGKTLQTADSILSAIPGVGSWAHLGLTAALLALGVYQRARVAKLNGEKTVAQQALDAANDGLQATGTAIQQAVNLMPPDHAGTLNRVLVGVHQAQGILPAIQHIIQPDLSTAGVHIDGGSSGPLPPVAPTPKPA